MNVIIHMFDNRSPGRSLSMAVISAMLVHEVAATGPWEVEP
jgi:hypothetical protein